MFFVAECPTSKELEPLEKHGNPKKVALHVAYLRLPVYNIFGLHLCSGTLHALLVLTYQLEPYFAECCGLQGRRELHEVCVRFWDRTI